MPRAPKDKPKGKHIWVNIEQYASLDKWAKANNLTIGEANRAAIAYLLKNSPKASINFEFKED